MLKSCSPTSLRMKESTSSQEGNSDSMHTMEKVLCGCSLLMTSRDNLWGASSIIDVRLFFCGEGPSSSITIVVLPFGSCFLFFALRMLVRLSPQQSGLRFSRNALACWFLLQQSLFCVKIVETKRSTVGAAYPTMSKKQQEEKHLKMLRQMLTQQDNKKCMDCKEKVLIVAHKKTIFVIMVISAGSLLRLHHFWNLCLSHMQWYTVRFFLKKAILLRN